MRAGPVYGDVTNTLPGMREAIEEERWADVDRYAALTGAALDATQTGWTRACA